MSHAYYDSLTLALFVLRRSGDPIVAAASTTLTLVVVILAVFSAALAFLILDMWFFVLPFLYFKLFAMCLIHSSLVQNELHVSHFCLSCCGALGSRLCLFIFLICGFLSSNQPYLSSFTYTSIHSCNSSCLSSASCTHLSFRTNSIVCFIAVFQAVCMSVFNTYHRYIN